jgi:hypothetical protein
MRTLFLGAAFGFIVMFGGLTIWVAAKNGVTAATFIALAILTMIGIGVFGALRNPPPEE